MVYGKHLESFRAQDPRGLSEPEDIRLQRIVLADDLELDPPCTEYLACHVSGRDRLLDGVAAGGIGQHVHAELPDQRPEALAGALPGRLAPQRHRHDLAAPPREPPPSAPPARDSARCPAAGASCSAVP